MLVPVFGCRVGTLRLRPPAGGLAGDPARVVRGIAVVMCLALLLGSANAGWASPAGAANWQTPPHRAAGLRGDGLSLPHDASAQHHLYPRAHHRKAVSRKRSSRARVVGRAVAHRARPLKKPPRRQPPRQRPVDHVHVAQSLGAAGPVRPAMKPEQLADIERGPPARAASALVFTACPASPAAAEILGARRVPAASLEFSVHIDSRPSPREGEAPAEPPRASPTDRV